MREGLAGARRLRVRAGQGGQDVPGHGSGQEVMEDCCLVGGRGEEERLVSAVLNIHVYQVAQK